jgi:hypothetical protein
VPPAPAHRTSRPRILVPVRRLLLLLLLVPLVAIVILTAYMVWTSSPSMPLTTTREQAILRATPDATTNGKLAWTRVESKLVTYADLGRSFPLPVGSFGYVDTTDRDALVWVVAYLGPMVSTGGHCEWVLRVFPADSRMPPDWSASECGRGHWPSGFDFLPDRSWFRADAFQH